MGEYTFVVEKTCPICGESTRVIKMKSRLIALKTDEDFCVHFKGVNPYYYKIWFCEHCGFAAEEKQFLSALPARHKAKLQEFLEGRKLALTFTPERGIAEAVASFKLAIFYAEMLEASLGRRAGLYLELAWIYRDAEDKEHEDEALAHAAALYDRSLISERYPLNGMSDSMCMYLIGAIYYRMNNLEKATQYLSRLIGDQNLRSSDAKLYDRARYLWQDIRELKAKAEEQQ